MTKNFSQDMEEELVTRNSDEKVLENDYFEKEFEKCQICMILNLDDIFVAESKSDLKEHLFSEHGIVSEKKTRQITKKEASEKSENPSNFPKFESKMEVDLEESTICEICDTEFPTAIRLKKHVSSVHGKAQMTKNKIPGIPSNLWQPIFPKSKSPLNFPNFESKVEVNLEESTICEICDTEFPTAIRLKKHIRSVHERAQITKNKIPGIPSNLWQPIFPKSGAKMEVDLDSSNDELEDDNLDANPSEFVDIKISDEKPEKTSYEVNNLQIIL